MTPNTSKKILQRPCLAAQVRVWNGQRISYVNDIRFRNYITAIIHRAIYLWLFFSSRKKAFLLITWNKKRYRSTPQTVRVTEHLFKERNRKKTTTTDDYKQVKTMKHPKKRQVMRKQTRFSIYLTTLIPILIFLLSNINCGCSYMAEWDPKKKKNQL